jgi:hypothetical protein
MTIDPTTKNSLVLRLGGKVEIPSALEIGKIYVSRIRGAITSMTEADKNDGSHTLAYKFEPEFVELITDTGEKMEAKDPKKLSQKIRGRHWIWQQENQSEIAYERFGQTLINKFDEVMEILK